MAIRTLLVDDEEPARERLKELLTTHADIEVVGEAVDGEQAIERILELKPDLVLLDIQMPGCNGMEVAASLPSPRPRIVFCTAYDEHAVDAFELHAVDYLLKPVTRARLEKAIERVRGLGPGVEEGSLERTAGVWPERFLARSGARYKVVPASEILVFSSQGSLTRLETAEHGYWMQPTLNDLETRLNPRRFFRISRSAIVSLDAVKEVLPRAGGGGEAKLADGRTVEVSRRRFKDLLARLG